DVDEADAAYHLLDALPLPPIVAAITALFLILVVAVFFITSSHSGSLVDDTFTNGGDTRPLRLQRAACPLTERVVTLNLLLLSRVYALDALQAASVVTGLPFAVILVLMLFSLLKTLRHERTPGEPRPYRAEDHQPPIQPPQETKPRE